MITKEQFEFLHYGATIYHTTLKNADGTPLRARITGAVKTWKRTPHMFQVPIKRGLYEYGYVTNETAHNWEL